MSDLDGLWKHEINPACTKSVSLQHVEDGHDTEEDEKMDESLSFYKQVAHWMFARLNLELYSTLLLALCDAIFWGQNRMLADPTWLRLRPELGLGLGTYCYFYCISCSCVNRLTITDTCSSVSLCSFEKEFETPLKFHLWF